MAFVRKLYYDPETGAVLESHMRQGSVRMTTVEEDIAAYPTLHDRTPDTVGCLVWDTPDPDIEDKFARATGVSVDISKTPPEPVFDFTPHPGPEPYDERADMAAALELLGVTPKEEE